MHAAFAYLGSNCNKVNIELLILIRSSCLLNSILFFQRFFGTIRQSLGPNDHPSAIGFIQIYKLLAVFGILKPPMYGNCVARDDSPLEPLIKISDIRDIYSRGENAITLLSELKDRLNGLIEQSNWDAADVIEHDYSLPSVTDALIYYITGSMCKKIRQSSKCDTCISAVTSRNPLGLGVIAELYECRSEGKLVHPNANLFRFIQAVEQKLELNLDRIDVYESTVENIIDSGGLSFPCAEHKEEIMAWTIMHFVMVRMRQHAAQRNNEAYKENCHIRKTSKFSKS